MALGLLARLNRPLRGIWILRRVLAELRGMRRALDRQADAMELASHPQPSVAGQTFRSYSRTKQDLSEDEITRLSEVSYVDERVLAAMLEKEEELRIILGRDPTEVEVERAYRGEIE